MDETRDRFERWFSELTRKMKTLAVQRTTCAVAIGSFERSLSEAGGVQLHDVESLISRLKKYQSQADAGLREEIEDVLVAIKSYSVDDEPFQGDH